MIDKKTNPNYEPASLVPAMTGDRMYAQDFVRDRRYTEDAVGKVLRDIFQQVPILTSGGVVTQGVGKTLDITLGEGYVKFSVEIPDADGTPFTKTSADLEAKRVSWGSKNDMNSSDANCSVFSLTEDSSTLNYVKVSYVETEGNTRDKAKSSGNYAYEIIDDYDFTVDATPPTDYELCLATFTSDGTDFTFSEYTAHKKLTKGFLHDYIRKIKIDNLFSSMRTLIISYGSSLSSCQCICYSPDLNKWVALCATASSRVFFYSTDGAGWAGGSPLPSANINWQQLIWSSRLGLFIACGDQYLTSTTQVMTSPNGTTWTLRNTPTNTNDVKRVVEVGSLLVGCSDSTVDQIITSTDAITWTPITLPSGVQLYDLVWDEHSSLFVALGGNDIIVTSPDGSTWTETSNTYFTSEIWIRMWYIDELEMIIAVSTGKTYAYSYDGGTTWEGQTLFPHAPLSIVYIPELRILVSSSQENSVAYMSLSEDGISYTHRKAMLSVNTGNSSSMKWSSEQGILLRPLSDSNNNTDLLMRSMDSLLLNS